MDMEARYQCRADDIARERYGVDFYELLPDTRAAVYCEAVIDVDDRLVMQAESLAERIWEGTCQSKD